MKDYEWMVSFTPQTEWIEKRGIFLWLAFYVGGLGGGFYLVSLYFNSLCGIFFSWLIVVVLKGGFHLIYLGHPLRFWRMFLKPQTSWISRGLIFVILFIALVFIQLLLAYFRPGTTLELVVKILAAIMAIGMSVYTGFVMNYVNAIQLWNSALLPVLFFLCSILGGFGLTVALGALGGNGNIDLLAAESGSRILLILNAVVIFVYLWGAFYMGPPGKAAVKEIVQGRAASVSWLGVFFIGIIIPLTAGLLGYLGINVSHTLLLLAVLSEIIGGLSLRYMVLKGGVYSPLIQIAI
jgi:formate-dependent nitrite reductase membrane component NrfD